jgi:polysaccharide export outer membrane protein
MGVLLAGCGMLPSAGPSADEVKQQAARPGEIAFDVVKVDDRVLAAVLAQPRPPFAARFAHDAQPPRLHIAVGDVVAVFVWEAAAGGLFTEAPEPLAAPGLQTEPLSPPSPEPGAPAAPGPNIEQLLQPEGGATPAQLSQALANAAGEETRRGIRIPDQVVAQDGGISVPFAGRIPAAGRAPQEVGRIIEQRRAGQALMPQALVLVLQSAANAATVAGEVVAGARIPLSPGGTRLLQLIAEAGGARAPVADIVVRLSRGGVTASIPLAVLVAAPKEDIFAEPGDILTLERVPKTFSVFGGANENRKLEFDAAQVSLIEALAKARGLNEQRADPAGVFLFRYEPVALVKALGMPPATRAAGGLTPVVYRFDLWDPKVYLLAGRFPLHDKDIVFVADAAGRKLYKFIQALNTVVGPVETGLLACFSIKC